MNTNRPGVPAWVMQRDNPGADRQADWLPVSSGEFYLIIRVYALAPENVARLKNPATFEGPPPVTTDEL
jgi:hypothetical protein